MIIVYLILAVNAGAYSFEAASLRHGHEWEAVETPGRVAVRFGEHSAATAPLRQFHDRTPSDRRCNAEARVSKPTVMASFAKVVCGHAPRRCLVM
jgi:hypothetical protein